MTSDDNQNGAPVVHRSTLLGAQSDALLPPPTNTTGIPVIATALALPPGSTGFDFNNNLNAAVPNIAAIQQQLQETMLLQQQILLAQHGIDDAVKKQAAAAARAQRAQKRREERHRCSDDTQSLQRKTSSRSTSKRQRQGADLDAGCMGIPNGFLPLPELNNTLGEPSGNNNDKRHVRAMKNRESAARSRAKRNEYTLALETQVEKLKEKNRELRSKVVQIAKAPADPHVPKLDGRPLRRTRTMPPL